ncbi:MAG: prepilin-type N-terminal cleavage/methylation domain-containing protein [Chthoniobacterales bacterium]
MYRVVKNKINRSGGFSILEMMVAMAVLMVLLVVLIQVTGRVGEIWRMGSGKITAFQNARSAFTTINRTLSQATLNTYNDYVDSDEKYRTDANRSSFVPAKFMRASELHFISGPAVGLVKGATAADNPGDAIFFQAAMGSTDTPTLNGLQTAMNSTGFYIQYGDMPDSLLPAWLKTLFASKDKKFRLIQVISPTEDFEVYNSTSSPNYDIDWLTTLTDTPTAAASKQRILAEDVCLLVVRTRLSPEDEELIGPKVGMTLSDSTQGSILAPNYTYDSRAWETGYGGGVSNNRKNIMRNQIPPIVDVAMVCLDPRTTQRVEWGSAPPAAVAVPPGLFTNSANMEADLETYASELTDAGLQFRIFRSSVKLQGAKWSNF